MLQSWVYLIMTSYFHCVAKVSCRIFKVLFSDFLTTYMSILACNFNWFGEFSIYLFSHQSYLAHFAGVYNGQRTTVNTKTIGIQLDFMSCLSGAQVSRSPLTDMNFPSCTEICDSSRTFESKDLLKLFTFLNRALYSSVGFSNKICEIHIQSLYFSTKPIL